ncbi:hypothetical protein FOMG_17480 [Fusarium oxysporum f. sp. melonis 26406]|uniref:Allergen Asp f 7 n=1 Tax=Fusarium oxysporum f. sp. melonis 26406 TaxID=1089452 RepID=W9ZXW5_FUSOX|nr:hypothetical protein FOMG_17480 [Fusarium oxysporum f. sp. melonis 26406]
MKILPLVPAFLTTVAAVQPQGIIEIEWPSNCGYASKATNPAIPAANPTVIETPKIASAQAGIHNPVATDAPVVDSYPPISSAGSTTKNEQVPDPGVYSPHSSPSAPVYSQQEQKSELKTGNSSPYGDVKSGSNGKTAQGTILDRCAGCRGGDIDVSHKIFIEIYGSLDPGRCEIEWWYS